MATDFWASSHYKRWLVDRATIAQARAEDLAYAGSQELIDFFGIYFANVISKLGKKLGLRQRVIATATVFFRRFYLKNSYSEMDPYLVIAACCYVAAKAEESPVHIKTVVSDARSVFSQDQYNVKHFPSDNTKLAEMEFYLVDDLECDLTVFHPYRTLLALCKVSPGGSGTSSGATNPASYAEAGELGAAGDLVNPDDLGVGLADEDGPRYWGTGEGALELSVNALQTAWFIINDTYRSNLCLLYPPHLIAIAAIYLTLVLHAPTYKDISQFLPSSSSVSSARESSTPAEGISASQSGPVTPRRSSRQSSHTEASSFQEPKDNSLTPEKQDPIAFLATLNVSLSLISTISQEIISLYALWDRYREDNTGSAGGPEASASGIPSGSGSTATSPAKPQGHFGQPSPSLNIFGGGSGATTPSKRSAATASLNGTPDTKDELFGDGGSTLSGGSSGSSRGHNHPSPFDANAGGGANTEAMIVTPAYLYQKLMRMRENKLIDTSHAPAVNRVVENLRVIESGRASVVFKVLGDGLLSVTGETLIEDQDSSWSSGDHHRRQRKSLNPVFSAAHMREMLVVFYDVVGKLQDALVEKINVLSWISRTALEIIGQSGLGYSFDPLTDDASEHRYSKTIKNLGLTIGRLSIFRMDIFGMSQYLGPPNFRRFLVNMMPSKLVHDMRDMVDYTWSLSVEIYEGKKKALAERDEVVKSQIGRGKDIISILMTGNLDDSVERLDEKEIIAQVIVISIYLVWSFVDLRHNFDVHTHLRCGEYYIGGSDLQLCNLQGNFTPLPFGVKHKQSSCSRFNVIPLSKPIIGRDGSKITELTIPKDTSIIISLLNANRNLDIWGSDAAEWKPERWLNPLPKQVVDKFQVHWKDHAFSVPTTGRITIDGVMHSGKVIHKGSAPSYTTHKRGFRESVSRLRPFVFSRLSFTDDDKYLDAMTDGLGDICLTIWKARLTKRLKTYRTHSRPREKTVVHETLKKGVDHRAGLDSYCVYRPGRPQVEVEKYGEPVARFVFRYRPLDVLEANGLVLSSNNTLRFRSVTYDPDSAGDRDMVVKSEILQPKAAEAPEPSGSISAKIEEVEEGPYDRERSLTWSNIGVHDSA
ncbi:hypothetical protein D9758_014295 [Tetrapyrgos nigripes]|uniref:Cyclin-like domain-containing protein n=1 Tax=Tetrapyrgos nigripes TaxID=182062 RepID=A0A8H5FFH9_9AGAR|nr:hypothetical protein D9758_014295 [Tetrapyrgos nigripes]